MSITPISPLPPAPSRNDAPADFITQADAWVAALPPWTDEANNLASEVNTLAGDTATNAAAAQSAADAALGAANFKGEWSDLTGALNIPASVSHVNKIWLLLNDLPDVTASEPGVTADWADITPSDLVITPIGPYSETAVAVPALDIVVSSGNRFEKTITANSNITFSGWLPGSSSFMFYLNIVGSFAPTFPVTVNRWVNGNAGSAPILTGDTTHLFGFETIDSGANVTGIYVGEVVTP